MRSIVSSLAFFATLSLQAQSPKLTPPDSMQQEQAVNRIRQFATTLDRLSCVNAPSPGRTMTTTIEFSEARNGTPSSVDAVSLLRDVFAVSSQAEIHWDHLSTVGGKKVGAYNYSFQINGKTHAGTIDADETTGAISRITFRGAEAPAHLFCSAEWR